MEKMDKTVTISISEKMLKELDYVRNHVSKSRYIQKLIQNNLDAMAHAVELSD